MSATHFGALKKETLSVILSLLFLKLSLSMRNFTELFM